MDNYRKTIREALSSHPTNGKILFAILTCEKLYPNYVYFKEHTGWGTPEILNEGIFLIYQYLINKNSVSKEEIQNVIDQVDNGTPHTEDFDTILVSFALDACNSVYSTLNYLLDGDVENIIDVATYARDTVDMYVQEKENFDPNDSNLEDKIAKDPFMIAEVSRQITLIKGLSSMQLDDISNQVIERLRSDKKPIIDLQLLTQ